VIAEVARYSPWSLARSGIYYVQGTRFPELAVYFYNFATRQSTLVYRATGGVELMPAKLSACPDGKTIYVTQLDLIRPEIVWADNFR
jgi:hypothetical protein